MGERGTAGPRLVLLRAARAISEAILGRFPGPTYQRMFLGVCHEEPPFPGDTRQREPKGSAPSAPLPRHFQLLWGSPTPGSSTLGHCEGL